MHHRQIIFLSTLLLLSACSSPEVKTKAVDELCSGTKRPYEINGTTYYPQDHYHYETKGQASWYGPNFDGKPGSCGSKYDMHAYTAAHKTLPIPSVVEVTNLENGRKLKLVVNDRGPFVGDRIIDLSKKAAIELGTHTKGLGHVHVKALPEDSIALANYLKQFGRYGIDPSGRAWDTIYKEEIAGQLEEKPHLLLQTTYQGNPSPSLEQQEPEDPLAKAIENTIHEEIQKDSILQTSQEPIIQSVAYTSPLSNTEQEKFDVLLEDLTGKEKNIKKKTLSTKKDLPKNPNSSMNSNKGNGKENTINNHPKDRYHFVQVGSFVNQNNARKLLKDLSSYGKARVVQEKPHFYTVQLGPYPSPQKAKRIKSTVMNKGHHGVRIASKPITTEH